MSTVSTTQTEQVLKQVIEDGTTPAPSAPTALAFRRGDKVQVNYTSGHEDDHYVGPGRFERLVRAGEGYDHELTKHPIAFVTVGRDRGCAFPLSSLTPR